jgi:hypothetical protein
LYTFKVAPEEMSFGGLMLHVAFANAYRFASLSGGNMPLVEPKEMKKQIGLRSRTGSFVLYWCNSKADARTTREAVQSRLVRQAGGIGPQLLMGMFVHTAHHRAQAEVYLRAKGIKPPVYLF